jgi:hypothetical protein
LFILTEERYEYAKHLKAVIADLYKVSGYEQLQGLQIKRRTHDATLSAIMAKFLHVFTSEMGI